jgi:uncharacterized protein YndB with AHSA1/START domain
MSISVCPAVVVAAPVESVWELLSEPTLYDQWWDAHTERIVPEGKATPGQIVYARLSAFGGAFKGRLTLRVESVDPEKHQVRIRATLPFGLVDDATITCTAIDAASCRVQFG